MSCSVSKHAGHRLQARSISGELVDALLDFGRFRHDHRGAEVVFFDHTAKARLRRDRPDLYQRYAERLNAYLVLALDGSLVTAGWRHRPFRHP